MKAFRSLCYSIAEEVPILTQKEVNAFLRKLMNENKVTLAGDSRTKITEAVVHRLMGGGVGEVFLRYEETAIAGDQPGSSLTTDFQNIARFTLSEHWPLNIISIKERDPNGLLSYQRGTLQEKGEGSRFFEEEFRRKFFEGRSDAKERVERKVLSEEEHLRDSLSQFNIVDDKIIFASFP